MPSYIITKVWGEFRHNMYFFLKKCVYSYKICSFYTRFHNYLYIGMVA